MVGSLIEQFDGVGDVEFELSIDSQDSFHRSALMISDWSGAAFEFALGTLQPVLFVDTPQKIFNTEWQEIGLPSSEAVMRTEVGSVVSKNDVNDVLAGLADSLVLNPRRSAEVGAQVLAASMTHS